LRILNMESLTNHGNKTGRLHVAQMLDAGLDMVDPYIGANRLISRNGSKLVFNGREFEMDGDPRSGPAEYDLDSFERIIIIGAAKGIQRCAVAIEEILGDYLTGGHVIGKHGDDIICKKLGVTLAGHPVPDKYCEEGCKKIFEWIKDITEKDFVITISGSGVSSLLTWPIEGVTIQDLCDITQMMQIEKGALTKDLNPVRVLLDRFKGGKISRYLKKASVVNLATNDLGANSWNPPGIRDTYEELMQYNSFLPTIADGSTFEMAVNSLKKYDVWDRVPDNIREYFINANPSDSTVGVEEYESMNARLFKLTPRMSMIYPAVTEKAKELGYTPYMLAETIQAEASEAGKVISSIALTVQNMGEPFKVPCILMSAGELIVTVGNEQGVGGRNQEFCLAAALKIAGSEKIVFGAVDTDGTDGPGSFNFDGAPECLCGAIVDGYTVPEAEKNGIDINSAIKTHNTSEPLWKLGCGVHAKRSISALDLRVVLIME